MYLNDEQLIDAIISYIFDHDQAILINGDWGSGKTYFINKKLIPALNATVSAEKKTKKYKLKTLTYKLTKKFNTKKNKNNKKKPQVVYLSLYGVSSLDDIKNDIYMSFVENLCDKGILKNKGSKIIKGSKLISKVILPHLDINKEIFDSIEIVLKEYSDNSSYIIIFDDIERCDIEVNQLLGYINGLVEHSSIKAILVGNEKEFLTHKIQHDLSQKFSVVLNERIDWQNNTPTKETTDIKDTQSLLTKDEIVEYTEQLFSSDIVYQKIKEKLIGLTVKYTPNFDNAYSYICDKYIKDKLVKEFLTDKKDPVINTFNERNHLNLRTLIFALISFEKIYLVKIINENEYDSDSIDEIRKKILIYIIELSIKIKTGQKLPKWESSKELSKSIYSNNTDISKKSITGYHFVDIYLCNGYLNTEMCQETITNYLDEEKKLRCNKIMIDEISKLSYNKIREWWKLEDEEIYNLLQAMSSELANMKYPPNYFRDIILLLLNLKQEKFEIDDILNTVKTSIEAYIEENKIDKSEYFAIDIQDDKFRKSYDYIVKPLLQEIKKNVPITDGYSAKNWFEKSFLDWCIKEHNNFLNMKKFISLVDYTEIISEIKKNNTLPIYNFLDGVDSVYNFSNLYDYFKSDLESISQILSCLEKEDFSNNSNTKKIAIRNLKDKLEKVKEILEK